MKRFVILVLLVVLTSSMVFAQANAKPNWISGEVSILGAGVRYERMLSQKISIGANAYYSTLFFLFGDAGIDFSFRFYPTGKVMYLGAALGFHYQNVFSGISWLTAGTFSNIIGVGITPEIGWKIDVGSKGGFFLSPGLKIPITLGAKQYDDYWYDDWYYGYYDNNRRRNKRYGGFGVGWNIIAYLGLGYAF